MHIIVDGYNLIRQSDVLRGHERKSLEAGRKALIRSLASTNGSADTGSPSSSTAGRGARRWRRGTWPAGWRSSTPAWEKRPTR